MEIKQKVNGLLNSISLYWNHPMPKRYMTLKEIAAYSGGGIGAYCIITLGTACMFATTNTLLTSTLGIGPTDMYIMYVICVLANIPLTGIRANIIDNTRNKAGKYRPYIVTMAIPTALLCVAMVWFPYDILEKIFPGGEMFGKSTAYIARCAIILVFNLLLFFFYNFFYDAYENLVHVLSPNSQERADVTSIKSVVYSLAPTLINLITPLVAQNVFKTTQNDIRVYRLLYPILTVFGVLLCIVVYKHTEEKIVQARTHVIQIRFVDALRAVMHNKYFWIISLASWVGFLELAYSNIMYWLYNYGGSCDGTQYGLITAIYGNSALWSMLLAPLLIRKWGKKRLLVITNLFNILFILLLLPATAQLNGRTIWYVLIFMFLNSFMSSFALILNPAIQADIRDYQHYKTGERIDGMFSAVGTIGMVITLVTSSVLPVIYEKEGLTEAVAAKVTSDPNVLSRVLAGGKTVGLILQEQFAAGQNSYINPNSALYDPNILMNLIHVLIIFSAVGALLNVLPYFFYDFTEIQQKSVVRVLKIRAMFEDFTNGSIKDADLVESIDIIRKARELYTAEPVEVSGKSYKKIKDKAERKAAKKKYHELLEYNDEIEISKFVCNEIDKFSTDIYGKMAQICEKIYAGGENAVADYNKHELNRKIKQAKALAKSTKEEKEYRSFVLEMARNEKSAYTAYHKYFAGKCKIAAPDFSVLEGYFNTEDACDVRLKELCAAKHYGKKNKTLSQEELKELDLQIKAEQKKRREAGKLSKAEMDKHAYYNRAAKPYLEAKKFLAQRENYGRFDEILEGYEEAKLRAEEEAKLREEENRRRKAEKKEYEEKLAAEKALKKQEKKALKKENKESKKESKKETVANKK